ncbi:unnamed protein product [Brassica oleracea var. botrytis]
MGGNCCNFVEFSHELITDNFSCGLFKIPAEVSEAIISSVNDPVTLYYRSRPLSTSSGAVERMPGKATRNKLLHSRSNSLIWTLQPRRSTERPHSARSRNQNSSKSSSPSSNMIVAWKEKRRLPLLCGDLTPRIYCSSSRS